MIASAVQGAQFDDIVGNVNSGFSKSSASTLQVSQHLPPPIAKIMSAPVTVSFRFSMSTFS